MASFFDQLTAEMKAREIIKQFPDLDKESAKIILSGTLEEHQILNLFNRGQLVPFQQAVEAIEQGAIDDAALIEKARNIFPYLKEGQKRADWERNHHRIKWAFLRLMQESARIPTTDQISELTGYSRVTITKHLREFTHSDFFGDQVQKYRVGFLALMDRMLALGFQGDTKAAKLYFDMMAKLDPALSTSTMGAIPATMPAEITGPVKVHPEEVTKAAQ